MVRSPTVVVTGTSRFIGARVAGRLAADPRVGRVIGLDSAIPSPALAELLRDVDQVRADAGAASGIIADVDAEAVVHLAVVSGPDQQYGGRAAMKEQNVIGTMQLLAACQQATRLRKLVVRSSTAAYGASFRDPAVFTEETEPREVPRGGFARDILDIESYVRGFRRRRPDTTATVLRFAPFIGSTAETSLTRYFSQPLVPTVFGRDPRLQFVHVDDALEVLHRAVVEDHPGTYNVAGPGVLTLSQAIRRAGRVAVPVLEPGLSTAAGFTRTFGVGRYGLDQIDLFIHGRVVDISRLTREFGFVPRSTAAAFDDFRRAQLDSAVLGADRLAAAEQAILAGIRRVRDGLADDKPQELG
ncbi:NAD-dependent epimerase/dehydratase family protein [Micromonospora sp. NBC_01813]|uniref:NAD-dependent epimerase/dehydratase family protein n=1 Tax=Micromonospora sp. NBC_01813 TaxID=2975988 RepID=UPI002DD9732C|nr:NAD-dependent epimerase/dehydratase family protein [Micromonospora sp. NBC_01813]WSA06462.1 NAD-dependent epimerase/dehydratase family protein [Micromonospora sp. NBC_01813]